MVTKPFCPDCPDREACHIGATCEYVRQVNFAFTQYDQRLKGISAMSNTAKNSSAATPKDVAEKVEEKKTVPAQTKPEVVVEHQGEKVELEVVDGEKHTFASRLKGLTEKLKANQKVFIGVTAAVAVATVTLVKFVQSQDKPVELTVVDDTEDADEQTETA